MSTFTFNFESGEIYLREMMLQVGLADPDVGIGVGAIIAGCPSVHGPGGIARSAIWRRLSRAVDEGLIKQLDAEVPRNTVYVPSDDLRRAAIVHHLKTRPSTRESVRYDHSLLEAYVPNATPYLRQSETSRLHAKCPPGTYKRDPAGDREMRRFMTDFAYASSKLEGVDYGLANTRSFFDDTANIGNMSPRDRQTLLNHFESTRFLLDGIHLPAQEYDVALTGHDIRQLHSILSHGLFRDTMLQGALRKEPVKIEGSPYMPLANPQEIERVFNLVMHKASKIKDPYEASMFLLVHLPYLQPFMDCNKRTARLACNIPLLRAGVLPVSWLDTNKDEFQLAVLAVYEKKETRLLAELFTAACTRSFENFTLTRMEAEPETLDLRYPSELRFAVRSVIESDALPVPETVLGEDAAEFENRVNQVVASIVNNPFVGAAFGVRMPTVERYLQRARERDEGLRFTASPAAA